MAKKHTIEEGDSYWDIAAKTWGGDANTINENRKRLQELNGGKALFAGDSLVLDDTPDGPVSNSKPEPKGIAPKTSAKPGVNGPDGARKPILPPRSTSGQGGERFAPKPGPAAPKKTGPGIKPPAGIFKTPAPVQLKGAPSLSTQGQGGERFAPKPAAPAKPSLTTSADARRTALANAAKPSSNADSRRAPVGGNASLKSPVSPRRDSVPTGGKAIFSAPKSGSGSFSVTPGKKK